MEAPTPALLVLSLPPSALVGIDLLTFTTTPRFQGVKSLPPGLHFVFASPHSTLAVRHGVWFQIGSSPSELVLTTWDAEAETLRREARGGVEELRQRANLGRIWKGGLTPYRQSATSATATGRGNGSGTVEEDAGWVGLSRHVTPVYLARVFGPREEDWRVCSYSDLARRDVGDEDRTESARRHDDMGMRLMDINLKRTWPVEATGRQRTLRARDRSWYMGELARRWEAETTQDGVREDRGRSTDEGSPLLAELQFCFLMALTLGNYTCVEQWRDLLRVVLTSYDAAAANVKAFVEFLSCLQEQIARIGQKEAVQTTYDNAQHTDGTDASRSLDNGDARGERLPLEERTEDQLLRYDLPVRSRKQKSKDISSGQDTRRTAKDDGGADTTGQDRFPVDGQADDELRQLFLESDADDAGDSFLRKLLVGFRAGVMDKLSEGEQMAVGRRELLRALSALEASLFELYGFEFDDDNARELDEDENGRQKTAAKHAGLAGAASPRVSRNAARRNETGLQSYDSIYTSGTGELRGGMRAEESGEDEGDEYAPAVVQLSQAEMDALGIDGFAAENIGRAPSHAGGQIAAADRMYHPAHGPISRVVVETDDSSDEGSDTDGKQQKKTHHSGSDAEEDLDDSMDIEEMDSRY